MTKRETYEVIANVFATLDNANRDEVIAFAHKEIAALDAKNAKARTYAAKRKAKGDAVVERIYDILAENGTMTIPEIMGVIDVADMTHSKVVARLTKLVKDERVTKVPVTLEGRKLTGYHVVAEEAEAEA